ncbi:MAG: hypothetical protein DMF76_22205 [Acidobacteria bacterium]|nr:MAG: hypothetical protein DMF76_22205 [Acidobacteriota bacterium]
MEADDSTMLNFFELGVDGRMHKVPCKIFPIGDFWTSDEDSSKYRDFQFELPRHGRTVLG